MNICYCASWLSKCPVIAGGNKKSICQLFGALWGYLGSPSQLHFCICLLLGSYHVDREKAIQGCSQEGTQTFLYTVAGCWECCSHNPIRTDWWFTLIPPPLWNSSLISNFNDHSFDPQNRGIYSSSWLGVFISCKIGSSYNAELLTSGHNAWDKLIEDIWPGVKDEEPRGRGQVPRLKSIVLSVFQI